MVMKMLQIDRNGFQWQHLYDCHHNYMHKHLLSQFLFPISMLIFLLFTLFLNRESATAVEPYKINFGETISVKSDGTYEHVDIEGIKSKKIKVRIEYFAVTLILHLPAFSFPDK